MAISQFRLLLATHNQHKIHEIKSALAGFPVDLLTLNEFHGAPEPVEDGLTLEENAIKKAEAIYQFSGLPSFADDTGLFVDALGGAPGVMSSRYAGEHATYAQNVQKLLAALEGVPMEKRQAHFRTVIALFTGKATELVEGSCPGHIALAPRGSSGFGYDPVFIMEASGRTLAEMSLEEKNAISHRGRALASFRKLLARRLGVRTE